MTNTGKGPERSLLTRLLDWSEHGVSPLDESMIASEDDLDQDVSTSLEARQARDMEEAQAQRAEHLISSADVYQNARTWGDHNLSVTARRTYNVLAVLLCLTIIAVLLLTTTRLPAFGSEGNPAHNEVSRRYIEDGLEETGAVNIVAGMILDYRAFDTLGESNVLFTAVCTVLFLLRMPSTGDADPRRRLELEADDRMYEPRSDLILQTIARLLVPMIMVFGIYVIMNGHLSPGGGFSGGAVIGAGMILYLNAFGFARAERFFTIRTFRCVSVCALSFYCLSKAYSFFTGANHLPSIITPGTPGMLFSAGLIPYLNIAVGLVVACTMYAFYTLFRKGDL